MSRTRAVGADTVQITKIILPPKRLDMESSNLHRSRALLLWSPGLSLALVVSRTQIWEPSELFPKNSVPKVLKTLQGNPVLLFGSNNSGGCPGKLISVWRSPSFKNHLRVPHASRRSRLPVFHFKKSCSQTAWARSLKIYHKMQRGGVLVWI